MNSKWIYRRILGILLVGLLVLGISACGKKGKEATTTALNVVTTEATTAATTEATEETTEATESTTEATEAATEATTEATTEAKTEEVTEEKTEEPTEEETEAPTEEETTAASDEELLDKGTVLIHPRRMLLYISISMVNCHRTLSQRKRQRSWDGAEVHLRSMHRVSLSAAIHLAIVKVSFLTMEPIMNVISIQRERRKEAQSV